MKVTKIDVKNFRLLKGFSIDLEENLSLIIGKNNCGKTSFLSILDKFLNGSKFSFDDFNLEEQEKIKANVLLEELPASYTDLGISMDIFIEYGAPDNPDNLKNIPILNLDPSKNTVILHFEYHIIHDDMQRLRKDFTAYKDTHGDNDFLRFVKKNYNDYFNVEIKAIDIDDRNNFIVLDSSKIKRIINFQLISAKREVANESSNKTLSHLAHAYFSKSDDPGETDRINLQKALIEADLKLTDAYKTTFEKVTNSIKSLSPNSVELIIQSDLDKLSILKENTSVMYKEGSSFLPEDHNGLGYMNFFAMIFHIHTICDEFKKKHKKDDASDINILFIEEPEAHTHPQMQYVFIQNIKQLLTKEKDETGYKLNNLQTIITTHSAHITAKSDFNDIKCFLRERDKNEIMVKNLSSLENEYGADPEGKRNFKFLKQYLTIHKSELFFADKAIFVEGDTERILLPAMIKKIDEENNGNPDYIPLLSQNISTVDVGVNSKTFEKFIDFLGIKTLIITDLDAVKLVSQIDQDGNIKYQSNGSTPKTVLNSCPVSEGESTSNPSINYFLAGKSFSDIKALNEIGKILSKTLTGSAGEKKWQEILDGQLCIAYQTEENGYYARSFEDSFISLNLNFIKEHLSDFTDGLKNIEEFETVSPNFYKIAETCIKSKTGFATDILFYSDENFTSWQVPDYIKKGLLWLWKK